MSTLTYNGIKFDVVSTLEHEKVPEYDSGNTYLWTKVRLSVSGLLNEDAMSYTFGQGGQVVATPPAAVGVFPATTLKAIQSTLLQPRGRLVYDDGVETIVISPVRFTGGGPNFTSVDVRNGPVPIECSIVEVMGMATAKIRFTIETFINESQLFKGGNSLASRIVSHRWTMVHDVNKQQYCTRTIKGRVIFRTDLTDLLPNYPDDFRAWFTHPVPDNWQRLAIRVVASEDGTSADYEVTDTEVFTNIVAEEMTDFKAKHSVFIGKPSVEEMIVGGFGGVVSVAANILAGGNPMDAVRSFAQTARNMAPIVLHKVVVDVWGHAYSRIAMLSRWAHLIADSRVVLLDRTLYSEKYQETRDMEEAHVQVTLDLSGGILAGIGNNGPDTLPTHFPARINVTDPLIDPEEVVTRSNFPGRVFLNDGGTRGNYLGIVIAQFLQPSYATPQRVTSPRNVRTATPP